MTSSSVHRETRVRMVAQPASVPAVRRFVDDALTGWGRADLVDDVSLSVTELATNATLHSRSTYFDVELTSVEHAVRVAVCDTGTVSGASIASRATRVDLGEASPGGVGGVGDLDDVALGSMTGRGLFIVSALASRWGIDDLPDGTRIWADFTGTTDSHEVAATVPVLAGVRPPQPASTGPVAVIRLLGCPPRLLLAHDDNLADVARELRLFGASHGDPVAVATAEQVAEVVRQSALSWDAARLVAAHAVQEGAERVDVAIAVSDPADLPAKVQVLRRAVRGAEQMAERGLLMTMPAPAEVQRWRDWVETEMTEQATTGRDPRPFGSGAPGSG